MGGREEGGKGADGESKTRSEIKDDDGMGIDSSGRQHKSRDKPESRLSRRSEYTGERNGRVSLRLARHSTEFVC